jgi:hypothetical protein
VARTAPPRTRTRPDAQPDAVPQPAPRAKDVPRTMKDLRVSREGRKKAAGRTLENPLREGLRLERVPDPCVLVLFGSTGDLAHR